MRSAQSKSKNSEWIEKKAVRMMRNAYKRPYHIDWAADASAAPLVFKGSGVTHVDTPDLNRLIWR